jgi:hypothetical protein
MLAQKQPERHVFPAPARGRRSKNQRPKIYGPRLRPRNGLLNSVPVPTTKPFPTQDHLADGRSKRWARASSGALHSRWDALCWCPEEPRCCWCGRGSRWADGASWAVGRGRVGYGARWWHAQYYWQIRCNSPVLMGRSMRTSVLVWRSARAPPLFGHADPGRRRNSSLTRYGPPASRPA